MKKSSVLARGVQDFLIFIVHYKVDLVIWVIPQTAMISINSPIKILSLSSRTKKLLGKKKHIQFIFLRLRMILRIQRKDTP